MIAICSVFFSSFCTVSPNLSHSLSLLINPAVCTGCVTPHAVIYFLLRFMCVSSVQSWGKNRESLWSHLLTRTSSYIAVESPLQSCLDITMPSDQPLGGSKANSECANKWTNLYIYKSLKSNLQQQRGYFFYTKPNLGVIPRWCKWARRLVQDVTFCSHVSHNWVPVTRLNMAG